MVRGKISITSLEDLRAGLEADIKERRENGPGIPKTTFEIIQELKPLIDDMRGDGWTDVEIVEALKKRGVDISASTMSRYLQKVRGVKGKGGRRPKVQTRSVSTEEVSSSIKQEVSEKKEAKPVKPSMANFESKEPSMDA